MFLSQLVDTIYAAGYDFNTAQDARRYIVSQDPVAGDEIMAQPLSTAQANPEIPDELAFEVLAGLSIPPEMVEQA